MVIPFGTKVDPEKTKAIDKCELHSNIKELQILLSMCNYYAKFVPKYACITTPFYNLLPKKTKLDWTIDCDSAFIQLKHALVHATNQAELDSNAKFVVETNASGVTIGVVLMQHD